MTDTPTPSRDDRILNGAPPGSSIDDGHAKVVNLRGYDPVEHNLMGLDVLHQDKAWKDGNGNVWLLEEMKPSHRANLLRFLRRRALQLAFRDAVLMWSGPFAPGGDMATMAAEEFTDWQLDNPEEWLEETALVKRLRKLVKKDEKRARKAAAKAERLRTVWDG